MRDSDFGRIVCIRKVFQMTAISVILVLIISIVIVVTTGDQFEEIDCGPVQNLEINETDNFIGATWEPPLGNDCFPNGLFNIEITVNEVIKVNRINIRETSIEIDKESCKLYRFGVQSIRTSGQPLQWSYETQMSRMTGSGKIQDLEIKNENTLNWTAPENSEDCDIKYIVKVDPEDFQPTENTVSTTSIDIFIIPCAFHLISVTTYLPESNNWTSEPVTISETGPITKLSPSHGSTWPTTNGARVNWIEQEEVNACNINQIQFVFVLTELKNEDYRTVQNNDISVDSWYELDDLSEMKEYSYKARWKLDDNNFSIDSAIINFQTQYLDEPIIDSEVLSEGDVLEIRWSQSYPNAFITKHNITVRDMGPMHFIPEACRETLLVWTFENDADDKTVIVSPVFPNHKYTIEVETIFSELNAYISNSTYHITDIEFPGIISNANHDHVYENGEFYSVMTYINWSFPCDANGPLEDFIIRIEGQLENSELYTDPTSCNKIEFLSKRHSCNENGNCTISTNNLLPFLKYTVFITTTSSKNPSFSRDTYWELTGLPDAYTPP